MTEQNGNSATFEVEGYDRVFPREQITTLLDEGLQITHELVERHPWAPADLIRDVFSVAHQMISTVQPHESGLVKAPPAMHIPRGNG